MILISADRFLKLKQLDSIWFEDLLLSVELICRLVDLSPDKITVCCLDSFKELHLRNHTSGINDEDGEPFQWLRIQAQLEHGILTAYKLQKIYNGHSLMDPQTRLMLEEQSKYILERVIETLPLP